MFETLLPVFLAILVCAALRDRLSSRAAGAPPSRPIRPSHENSSGWHGGSAGFCINPATGLPMMSGSMEGFDTGGNLYGFDNSLPAIPVEDSLFPKWLGDDARTWDERVTNPTTGLPMMFDSTVGVDVGGNLYGSSNDWSSGYGSSNHWPEP